MQNNKEKLKNEIKANGWSKSVLRVRVSNGDFNNLDENTEYQVLDGNHRRVVLCELIDEGFFPQDFTIDVQVYDILDDMNAMTVSTSLFII